MPKIHWIPKGERDTNTCAIAMLSVFFYCLMVLVELLSYLELVTRGFAAI